MRIYPSPLPLAFMLAISLLPLTHSRGGEVPKDCEIPELSLSPDHKLGVVVPDYLKFDESGKKMPPNTLVDVASGKVLATLQGEVGNLHESNMDLAPSWSQDGSILIWGFHGKWTFLTVDVLKIEDGAVKWQTNLLERAQKEILARTKKADPKRYAKKKEERGNTYTEGFAIELIFSPEPEPYPWSPVKFSKLPLKFVVTLTSDPKDADESTVKSELEGQIDGNGKVTFSHFHLVKE